LQEESFMCCALPVDAEGHDDEDEDEVDVVNVLGPCSTGTSDSHSVENH